MTSYMKKQASKHFSNNYLYCLFISFQALLDRVGDSKLPYALKALFDAMKFKYKKLYDHVMSVRKQTYKEGVVTTIGKIFSGLLLFSIFFKFESLKCTKIPFE